MAKVFITKYALTSGIKEMELDIRKTDFAESPDYVRDASWTLFFIGKDAFLNKDDAIKRAEEMRKKKVASLEKQLDKLKRLSF